MGDLLGLMVLSMEQVLENYFSDSRGVRSEEEVASWLRKHHAGQWTAGKLREHLQAGQVNRSLSYKQHPFQKKFLFGYTDRRYELYQPEKHGFFRDGEEVPANWNVPMWILIHTKKRYSGEGTDNPKDELEHYWRQKNWNRLWHWKRPSPLKEDNRPRTLLLAWDGAVFGEAKAMVTRAIDESHRAENNFAFRLLDYTPLRIPIPFSALALGSRENSHRDLIRITRHVWDAYEASLTVGNRLPASVIPEAMQNDEAIETGVNPHLSRQGYGLTAKEKRCVELHAMDLAAKYLLQQGYRLENVSKRRPFDILAERKGETLSVEVKGTTGRGAEILLTKGEVAFQRLTHPANMLIIVHSINLERGPNPRAVGGVLERECPWLLDEKKLKPYAYSYTV